MAQQKTTPRRMTPNSDSGSTGSPPAATQGRQRPGEACEECRRRKLRCDRQQPQCGVCREAGTVCEVNTQRAARGPKKGYLKALKNRVAMLESRLAERGLEENPLSPPLTDLADGGNIPMLPDFDQIPLPTPPNGPVSEPGGYLPNPGTFWNSPIESSAMSLDNQITELIQAELDQLYFDRVYPSILLLHQRRYLSWSRQPVKKTSQTCLQYAMWSLASLLSAQFQHLQESLYQRAKQMLEYLSLNNNDQEPEDIEQAQAWILIATYESMRTFHRQAWLSAGRAFRLVQLMRLQEIDAPFKAPVPESEFIETEEKRRVFWVAYFLDHLFSIQNDWPITLNEHVICTRLPAPEAEFQSGQHVLGSFLSDAITEESPTIRSPVQECIILLTICGRGLFQGQQYNVRCVYGDAGPCWSDQHRWLDSVLNRRLQVLSQYYPPPTEMHDPVLLFANIMAQATIIYICKSMESLFRPTDGGGALVMEYKQRALDAAEKIVNLSKSLKEFHVYKVHPLMPIPLFLCAEFLYNNRSSYESFNLRLQELLDTFRQLRNVNDTSQSYIQLLGLTCSSTSSNLAREQASI